MGQGDYWPGCMFCAKADVLGETDKIRHCLLHSIPIPDLIHEGDVLCHDWKLASTSDGQLRSWIRNLPEHYGKYIDSLSPGVLYFFSVYEQGHSGPFCVELEPIKSIKNYMFEVEVRSHKEYGWVIYPENFKGKNIHLPEVGQNCEVFLDGERYEFTIGNGIGKILRSPKSPQALRHWADKYFDLEAIVRTRSHVFEFWDWGINAFMEVIKPKEAYALRPVLQFNSKHMRDRAIVEGQ